MGELQGFERCSVAGGERLGDLVFADTQAEAGEIDPVEPRRIIDERCIAALSDRGENVAHRRIDVFGGLAFHGEECGEMHRKVRRTRVEPQRPARAHQASSCVSQIAWPGLRCVVQRGPMSCNLRLETFDEKADRRPAGKGEQNGAAGRLRRLEGNTEQIQHDVRIALTKAGEVSLCRHDRNGARSGSAPSVLLRRRPNRNGRRGGQNDGPAAGRRCRRPGRPHPAGLPKEPSRSSVSRAIEPEPLREREFLLHGAPLLPNLLAGPFHGSNAYIWDAYPSSASVGTGGWRSSPSFDRRVKDILYLHERQSSLGRCRRMTLTAAPRYQSGQGG